MSNHLRPFSPPPPCSWKFPPPHHESLDMGEIPEYITLPGAQWLLCLGDTLQKSKHIIKTSLIIGIQSVRLSQRGARFDLYSLDKRLTCIIHHGEEHEGLSAILDTITRDKWETARSKSQGKSTRQRRMKILELRLKMWWMRFPWLINEGRGRLIRVRDGGWRGGVWCAVVMLCV